MTMDYTYFILYFIVAGQNEVEQWVWPLYNYVVTIINSYIKQEVIPNRKWSESQTESEGLINGQEVINNHY